ncbi:MAG: cytochrome c oxidase subunit II [Gemmatimonadetes bacterium]|nr:MAG: cytochrome c oxidase subunit II [Gemmatimonadota bacterium]
MTLSGLGRALHRVSGLARRWAALLSVLALVALAGCAGEYPQSTIDPKTDFAETIHGLYVNVFWWTMLILAIVWIALAYVLVRFRARPDAPPPKPVHGHLGLEIGWTIGPALIVVAIAVPTIKAVFETQRHPAEGAMVVEVIGHRYWWEFRYPETGVVTANELHLPVGRPVSLRLHTADVIHSFWVPQLGGKRDLNPLVRRPEGEEPRYNWLHFTVKEEGTFMGQCAEFCGEAHSLMRMRVVAESEDDFQAWTQRMLTVSETALAPQADSATGEVPAEDPLVAQGRQAFFGNVCVACHAIQGTTAQGQLGPNLTRLGARSMIAAGLLENTQENLEHWIKRPYEVKPGVRMPGADQGGGGFPPTNLTDEQVHAIAAYLLSLR